MHVSNSSLGTSNQSSSSNSMRQPNRLSFPRRRPFPLSHSDPSSPVPSPIGNDVTDPFRLHRAPHVPITPRQSDVSASMLWLSVYFGLNLGLTLFNKTLLVHFPYPYTLTSVHAMVGSMGCYGLEYAGLFKPKVLKVSDTTALGLFSLLYTLNIVVSNKSLHLVTIPVRRDDLLPFWMNIDYLHSFTKLRGLYRQLGQFCYLECCLERALRVSRSCL